jgi:hypothetical protein
VRRPAARGHRVIVLEGVAAHGQEALASVPAQSRTILWPLPTTRLRGRVTGTRRPPRITEPGRDRAPRPRRRHAVRPHQHPGHGQPRFLHVQRPRRSVPGRISRLHRHVSTVAVGTGHAGPRVPPLATRENAGAGELGCERLVHRRSATATD